MNETAQRKATVTTTSDREIVSVREFDAPRDLVFETMMDPELIPEWWGPRDSTTAVDRMEVKTGGDWRFVIREADGTETAFRGTFREVTPSERVVQTFEWDGMPGYICATACSSRGWRKG